MIEKMDYIDYKTTVLNVDAATTLPKAPQFQTIYVSGGKKNKLNKIDIQKIKTFDSPIKSHFKKKISQPMISVDGRNKNDIIYQELV